MNRWILALSVALSIITGVGVAEERDDAWKKKAEELRERHMAARNGLQAKYERFMANAGYNRTKQVNSVGEIAREATRIDPELRNVIEFLGFGDAGYADRPLLRKTMERYLEKAGPHTLVLAPGTTQGVGEVYDVLREMAEARMLPEHVTVAGIVPDRVAGYDLGRISPHQDLLLIESARIGVQPEDRLSRQVRAFSAFAALDRPLRLQTVVLEGEEDVLRASLELWAEIALHQFDRGAQAKFTMDLVPGFAPARPNPRRTFLAATDLSLLNEKYPKLRPANLMLTIALVSEKNPVDEGVRGLRDVDPFRNAALLLQEIRMHEEVGLPVDSVGADLLAFKPRLAALTELETGFIRSILTRAQARADSGYDATAKHLADLFKSGLRDSPEADAIPGKLTALFRWRHSLEDSLNGLKVAEKALHDARKFQEADLRARLRPDGSVR